MDPFFGSSQAGLCVKPVSTGFPMGPCYGPPLASRGFSSMCGPVFGIWYIVGMYWGADEGPIANPWFQPS